MTVIQRAQELVFRNKEKPTWGVDLKFCWRYNDLRYLYIGTDYVKRSVLKRNGCTGDSYLVLTNIHSKNPRTMTIIISLSIQNFFSAFAASHFPGHRFTSPDCLRRRNTVSRVARFFRTQYTKMWKNILPILPLTKLPNGRKIYQLSILYSKGP
jgi:hypothetical protein